MRGEKADSLILIKENQIQCKQSSVVNHLAVCLTYLKVQNFKPAKRDVCFYDETFYQWNAYGISLDQDFKHEQLFSYSFYHTVKMEAVGATKTLVTV
jgi:hypothetical protein